MGRQRAARPCAPERASPGRLGKPFCFGLPAGQIGDGQVPEPVHQLYAGGKRDRNARKELALAIA